MVYMGADAIYQNRPLNVEFLDEKLRMKDASNILQHNPFIVFVSLEMITVARFFSIMHAAIVIPFDGWLVTLTIY